MYVYIYIHMYIYIYIYIQGDGGREPGTRTVSVGRRGSKKYHIMGKIRVMSFMCHVIYMLLCCAICVFMCCVTCGSKERHIMRRNQSVCHFISVLCDICVCVLCNTCISVLRDVHFCTVA